MFLSMDHSFGLFFDSWWLFYVILLYFFLADLRHLPFLENMAIIYKCLDATFSANFTQTSHSGLVNMYFFGDLQIGLLLITLTLSNFYWY